MMLNRIILITIGVLVFGLGQAKAESQDACAIWLCLPGGFPQGCSSAYDEFRDRIKHGKPPLPPLSACSVGGTSDGYYELGVEYYEPCSEGYVLREYRQPGSYNVTSANCYKDTCAPEKNANVEYAACENYAAIKRVKPSYVKMWVDGQYLGQFFY